MADNDDLDRVYTYHRPKAEQAVSYESIRSAGRYVAEIILELCPHSRERSLALTNLEQSIMWANAAIARNQPDEE